MHRKLVFSLAAAFLVVALVVPPAIVLLSTTNPIYKYIVPGNYPTQGATNVTITITSQQRAAYTSAFIIAGIIEVVFIILFIITMYYGFSHAHPEHLKEFK